MITDWNGVILTDGDKILLEFSFKKLIMIPNYSHAQASSMKELKMRDGKICFLHSGRVLLVTASDKRCIIDATLNDIRSIVEFLQERETDFLNHKSLLEIEFVNDKYQYLLELDKHDGQTTKQKIYSLYNGQIKEWNNVLIDIDDEPLLEFQFKEIGDYDNILQKFKSGIICFFKSGRIIAIIKKEERVTRLIDMTFENIRAIHCRNDSLFFDFFNNEYRYSVKLKEDNADEVKKQIYSLYTRS